MGLEGCREGDGTMIDMQFEWLTLEWFVILIGLYVLIRLGVGTTHRHTFH